MLNNYLFVSCDIVAHSAESELAIQRKHIIAINEIVAGILKSGEGVVWASGGDGGHIAFPGSVSPELVFALIAKLRAWSTGSGVPLRITGSSGEADAITGADGRTQLVGDGINLAGRLLAGGSASQVIITRNVMDALAGILPPGARVHDRRIFSIKSFGEQELYLLSVDNQFQSGWDQLSPNSDRMLVQKALVQNDFLEVIYRARRLLELNADDAEASNALRTLALKNIRPTNSDNFFNDLLFNLEFGFEMISAGTLIERRRGDILCDYKDEGETMFLILSGRLGVFLPKDGIVSTTGIEPDFIMREGELAGEIAFQLRRRRTATLQCMEDTAMLAFSYNEMMKAFTDDRTRTEVIKILDKKILTRILENLWNTAPYFCNGEKTGLLHTMAAPWLTLMPFSKIVDVPWHPGTLQSKNPLTQGNSLVILLSGQLETTSDEHTMIDGIDYPVLFASFPGEFASRVKDYRLVGSIKLLIIREEGLPKLDRVIYNEMAARIKNHVGSLVNNEKNTKNPPPVTSNKHVFISYCRDNKDTVRNLRRELLANDLPVWWDEDIEVGQDWKFAIRLAMKNSFAVILCLSTELGQRSQSGVYPEILDAIASFRECFPGSVYLMPVKISPCEIPPIEIDSTRTLDRIHYIDLFPEQQWKDGIEKLVKACKNVK